jgi:hypothetical protein
MNYTKSGKYNISMTERTREKLEDIKKTVQMPNSSRTVEFCIWRLWEKLFPDNNI